eukprot:UN26308
MGFKLGSLFAVSRRKGKNGTWLQQICKTFEEKDPDALKFVDDLKTLQASLKHRDVTQLEQDCRQLLMNRNRITKMIKAYKKPTKLDKGFEDRFVEHFSGFLEYSQEIGDQLTASSKELIDICAKTSKDFGEPEFFMSPNKKVNTNFLESINKFVHDTEVAIETNAQMLEKQKG